jgi:hypothetical protein
MAGGPTLDVLICYQCHSKEEIHGVGFIQTMKQLGTLIVDEEWGEDKKSLNAKSLIGSTDTRMIAFLQSVNNIDYTFISWGEDEIVFIARSTGHDIEYLIQPYVERLKLMPQIIGLCIGFDLSVPASFQNSDLYSAGIASYFRRSVGSDIWTRQELRTLVGHYL